MDGFLLQILAWAHDVYQFLTVVEQLDDIVELLRQLAYDIVGRMLRTGKCKRACVERIPARACGATPNLDSDGSAGTDRRETHRRDPAADPAGMEGVSL